MKVFLFLFFIFSIDNYASLFKRKQDKSIFEFIDFAKISLTYQNETEMDSLIDRVWDEEKSGDYLTFNQINHAMKKVSSIFKFKEIPKPILERMVKEIDKEGTLNKADFYSLVQLFLEEFHYFKNHYLIP